MEINHKWVSAKAYAKATGLSPEKAIQMVRNGTLEGTQTEGGYWKIKVYDNDAVSREVFEKERARVIELETIVNSMKNMLEGAKL